MTTSPKTKQLSVLCSARVRLNDEQRQKLKEANAKHRLAASTPSLPGSTVKTQTFVNRHSQLHDLTITDLITTRETITLAVILKLEKILNVQLVTKKQLTDAFASYVDYMYGLE